MAFQVPSKTIKASELLSRYAVVAAGGAAAVGNSLGVDRQNIDNDMRRGYVPLKKVYEVSQLLGISPWVVSYHKLMEIFGKDSPKFETIVSESNLFPSKKKTVLDIYNGKKPVSAV